MKPLIEQLTRERLEALIDDENCRVSVVEQEILAQIALAVMDAKPVAYTDRQELSFYHKHTDMWKEPHDFGQDVELYTTPPAASVPDNHAAVYAAAQKLVKCKGRYHAELNYKALAELFGVKTHEVAEPVLPNSPAIPEGWKLVPVDPTQAMIDAHTEGMISGGASKAYCAMLAAAPEPGAADA